MGLFTLEHSKAAYRADFAVCSFAVVLLAGFLLADRPRELWLELLGWVITGLAGWTAIEYALHRCVLHGVHRVLCSASSPVAALR